MSDSQIKTGLTAHPFCARLSEHQIDLLAGMAKVETFEEDRFVFREGGDASNLHLITDGVVKLELSSPRGVRVIDTLDDTDALGLSWVATKGRWLFDARAETHVVLVVIDGGQLLQLMERDCAIGYEIMRQLVEETAERLQATRMRLMDVYR